MKVVQGKGNTTIVYFRDWEVLVSYSTPVAAKHIPSGKCSRTDKHYSVTTSKHINQWLDGRLDGRKAEVRSQEFFNKFMED